MYCYVFESPNSPRLRRLDDEIITKLRGYGISGEVVFANPARPAREITKVALKKGYSTIIAVGSDRVINGVVEAVQSTKAAMGIIPINAHPRVKELIGTIDPFEACEILRHRQLINTDVTFIDPGQHFLTEAKVEITGEQPVRVHVDDAIIETRVTDLILLGNGTIELIDSRLGRSILTRSVDWLLGKDNPPANISRLKGKYIKVETLKPLPIKIGTDIIGKTPFIAAVKPKCLKLITKRGILSREVE